LAKKLIESLKKYDLKKKMIAYVKDEGSKLNTMIIVFKSIISCDIFGLKESFHGTCFGHALSKAC
jgi:hypothetical protein